MKRTFSVTEPVPSSVTTAVKRYKASKSAKRKSTTRSGDILKTARHLTYNALVYTGSAGWNGGFRDLGFQYTLGRLNITIGGIVQPYVNMPSISEFTNLFDQYKIDSIDIEIFTSHDFSNSGIEYPNPVIYIVNDYDSAGSFNLSDINQYPNAKAYQLVTGKKIKWQVKPQFKGDVLTDTGITSSSVATQNGWMDCTTTNVLGFGTRIYVDSMGAENGNAVCRVTFRFKFNMSFRYPK